MGEPDERPHPDGPCPDDRADDFDAIVAGWRREGGVPHWPADEPEPPAPEDDHFVPPEPPPLPRIGPPAAVGLVLLALGIVLVAAPAWIGVPDPYGLPLGLLTLATGLGWLVLRLWPAPPGPGEYDDGAVL